MRNKKLTNRRNDITQGWWFCTLNIALEKDGEKKKKKSSDNTGIRIWSPTQVLSPPNRA